MPSILADLANIAADRADHPAALRHASAALAIAERRSNGAGVASALDALGRAQLGLGSPALALDTWAEADAVRVEIRLPVERRDRARLDHDRQRADTLLTYRPDERE